MSVPSALVPSQGHNTGSSNAQKLAFQQNHEMITLGELTDEYQNWFGPVDRNTAMGALDSQAVVTYHLPDVFRGRSLYMRDTIVGMATRNNEWYTTLALPWMQTREQHFAWTEFQFNTALAGEVPPEGIPRLLTSQQATFQKGTTRRGLAFLIEAEFYKSAQGQEMYRRNFRGIREAIKETANLDVSYEISGARKRFQNYNREKNQLMMKIDDIAGFETWSFAVMQKGQDKAALLLNQLKEAMADHGVTPNLMIVPPGTGVYYGSVRPERTQYLSFGSNNELLVREGPEAVGSIQGMLLLETRRMAVTRVSAPIEPFLKTLRHGTHVPMLDTNRGYSYKEFTSAWRSVVVWDETNADYVSVSIRDAILNSMRFKKDGSLRDEHYALARMGPDDGTIDAGGDVLPDGGYNPMTVSRGIQTMTKSRLASEFRDMFLYKRDNATFGVVEFFGLMDTCASTNEDFRAIASIAADQLFDGSSMSQAEEDLTRLEVLMEKSEEVEYDQEYYMEMIKANLKRQFSLVGNKTVFGQLTAEDVSRARGLPRQLEMRPNQHGSLDIPFRGGRQFAVPPHMNSWPALMTLASLRGKNSGWEDAIEEVVGAIRVIRQMVDKASQTFASSLFLNPELRPAWFQKPDRITTFFHDIIGAPRDGVFLVLPADIVDQKAQKARAPKATDPSPSKSFSSRAFGSVSPDSYSKLFKDLLANDSLSAVAESIVAAAAAAGNTKKTPLSTDEAFWIMLSIATEPLGGDSYTEEEMLDVTKRARRIVRVLGALSVSNNAEKVLEKLLDTKATLTDEPSKGVQAASKGRRFIKTMFSAKEVHEVELNAKNDVVSKDEMAKDDEIISLPLLTPVLTTWIKGQPGGNKVDPKADNADPFDPLNPGDLEFTEDGYKNSIFVRAPLNSSMAFAKSALSVQRPLALPSDPTKAHIAPFAGSRDPALNAAILSRHQYARISQRKHMAPSSLNVSDALISWEIPDAVMTQSGMGVHEELASSAASRLSRRAGVRSRGGGVHSSASLDSDDSSGFAALLGTMKTSAAASYKRSHEDEEEFDPYDREVDSRDRQADYSIGAGDDFSVDTMMTPEQCQRGFSVAHAAMVSDAFRKTHTEVSVVMKESVFKNRWIYGGGIPKHVVRAFHQTFLGCANNGLQWLDLIDTDNNPPCGMLLWRLNITRQMQQVPVMVGGYSTGATTFGNTDVQMGDDVITKVLFANVTFYMTALVVNPLNINIAEGAVARSYEYGRGVDFISKPEDVKWQGNEFHGDIIATMIPQTERKFPNPMSIYGQHVMADLNVNMIPEDQKQLHYGSAPYTTLLFNLKPRVTRLYSTQKDPRYGSSNIGKPNIYSYRDWSASHDPIRKRTSAQYIPTVGHLGPNGTGPNATLALAGRMVMFGNDNGWQHGGVTTTPVS